MDWDCRQAPKNAAILEQHGSTALRLGFWGANLGLTNKGKLQGKKKESVE